MIKTSLFALGVCLIAGSALATPITMTEAEMDNVTAGSFVCPVIETAAVTHSPLGIDGLTEGDYSIVPPAGANDLTVPVSATNADGLGEPFGAYSSPGETDYTAIWFTP